MNQRKQLKLVLFFEYETQMNVYWSSGRDQNNESKLLRSMNIGNEMIGSLLKYNKIDESF
jgi:hypothetical protein